MKTRFWKYTILVAVIHALVLAGLFGFSILPKPLETPREMTISVSYAVEPTPIEAESAPEPIDEPTPEPSEPATPEVVAREKIELSTTKIRRKLPNQRPDLSPEDIQKILSNNTDQHKKKTISPDPDSRYMSLIRDALYSAWLQPSAEAVGDAAATASISLGWSGDIVARELIKSSGVSEMDRSIMNALNAVKKVNGLPASFLEQHAEVTILFKVEG